MELFHGSLSKTTPKGALTFWGPLDTSIERAESLFMNHEYWRGYQDGTFYLLDMQTEDVIGTETPTETLTKFSDFMGTLNITSYELDIATPLRLVDCWEDDPIGSGAMQIFNESSGLNHRQHNEIAALFAPYTDIIYPDHVAGLSSREDIAHMFAEGQKDPVFTQELEKRRARSESLGIPFAFAADQEIVWVSLTTKLRAWALENGYDSFVYQGRHEGKALDCHVTLTDNQFIGKRQSLTFNKEAFLGDALPIFEDYLQSRRTERFGTDAYWSGLKPKQYWI